MTKMLPDQGHSILIAMPQLADENFAHSVTLIASFDQQGAFGLIQNRLTNVTAQQLLADQIELPEGLSIPVYYGGPVQPNSLWFLHSYEEHSRSASVPVVSGLYLSSDLKTVEAVLKDHAADESPRFRLFIGYAGWTAGQLERELAQGSWVAGPIDTGELFSCPSEDLWDASLSRLGVSDPNLLVMPMTSGDAH